MNEYDKRVKEINEKMDDLQSKINGIHNVDKDYYITSSYLLELANRAHELFVSSKMDKKRELIQMLFQNLELDVNTVRSDFIKPYDQIFKYADRQAWLRRVDHVRTLFQ